MGKYTVYGTEIDLKIQEQLDKIIKVIKKYIDPISVILIGGFGRGEGSIIHKKNKFIPINDYDMYAITSKPYPNKIIEKMCSEASESIGKKCINFEEFSEDMEYSIEKTFYPDIRVITLDEIKTLPPFLKYFEIKYGATTIYGKEIISKMPEFKLEEVPKPEAWRFLMNRLSLMIMHFSPTFLKNPIESDVERTINFNQKTAMSCAEALLFYSQKYNVKYQKRAEILKKTYKTDFPELAKKIPKLPEIIEKYTQQKLKPDYQNFKNPIQDWFIVRDYAGEVIKFLLFKFTGEKPESIEEISRILNKSYPKYYINDYVMSKFRIKNKLLLKFLNPLANLTLNILYIKRIYDTKKKIYFQPLRHPFTPPDLKLFAATFPIIFSLNKNGSIDAELFKKSRKYLKQMYFDNTEVYEKKDWELMRELYGTAFRMYAFQKII